MKKIILLTLILSLCACSAKKKLSRSVDNIITEQAQVTVSETEKQIVDESSSSTTETDIQNSVKKIVEISNEGNATIKGTVYDTTKPVNPETGRPPILVDFTVEKGVKTLVKESEDLNRHESQTQQTEEQKTETVDRQTDMDATMNSEAETKIVEKTEIKKKTPFWVWITLGGTLLGVFILARKNGYL